MIEFASVKNYIIVKNSKELQLAKQCNLCRFIIWERKAVIDVYKRDLRKWVKETYHFFNDDTVEDNETTGMIAYQSFYSYCGREEVERMKNILPLIETWESEEQIHYYNFDNANEKIYKDIYVFDANSSFTYGVMMLPNDFNILKEYMYKLYTKKSTAKDKLTRQKYKNLQNFLIGYFARIKNFVSLRSEIIKNSNKNIYSKMREITQAGGIVYISNTDSIVTDSVGAEIMQKYIGSDVGQFKLEKKVDRLFYQSSNSYQLGDKLVYSGVGYFARKNTDLFKEKYATQSGSLIESKEFIITENENYKKLCTVQYGKVIVRIENKLGELLATKVYKIGDNNG